MFFLAALLVAACSRPAPVSSRAQSRDPLPQKPAPVACTPAANRLCPSDEGPSDATFVAFRQKLRAAVEHRSEAELMPLIATNVRTSFGAGGGAADFRKQWKTSSSDSKLWPTLARVLDNGGSFQSGTFWAPYVYSKWPESIDAFEHVAALHDATPIYSKPADGAPKIATVDWEILTISAPSDGEWTKVRTASGVEGWVSNDDVYSPIGYRAGFSNRDGDWKLEALVAGD